MLKWPPMAKKMAAICPWRITALLFLPLFVLFAESCVRQMSKSNTRLNAKAFLTVINSTLEMCYAKCATDKFCRSFNLDLMTWTCYLLSISSVPHFEMLQNAYNWVHVTNPDHPCNSNPCQSGEVCAGPKDNIECVQRGMYNK